MANRRPKKKQERKVTTTALSHNLHARVDAWRKTVASDFGPPSLRAAVEALVVAGLEAKGAP